MIYIYIYIGGQGKHKESLNATEINYELSK